MWISRTYLHNWNFVPFDHRFPIYPSFQPLANTIWLCAGLDGTEPTCNAGDRGSIPRSGRSPGEGNGYTLQYSCLEKSMDRGASWATAQGSQRVGHDWVTNTFTSTSLAFLDFTYKWYYMVFVFLCWAYWRRQWQPTPVLLPGKSHRWRSLMGCSPWGRKESDTTEQLHFHFSLSCIGEGNGNPLQCSCLENPRDGGARWAAVYGVAQSRTRLKQLSSSGSWAYFTYHNVVINGSLSFLKGE